MTDKHQRILQAASKVFAKRGFYNSRVSDIAKEANVADGTIYLYFKNKDDILISLFEDVIRRLVEETTKSMEGIKDPLEKLRHFAITHIDIITKDHELAEVIQVELRQSSHFMKDYENKPFRDYLNIIRSIIVDGQEMGVIRKDITPGIFKRSFFGALDEMARYWVLSSRKKHDILEAAREISDMIVRGIRT
ncbi:MAG: TetR/AcrR family transcriptional regulator [Thermodesulfobacteriota bacterium]|nr:TetR/AcrR family transcriptional regulator [Thermodesulfobacteriota bacterium]